MAELAEAVRIDPEYFMRLMRRGSRVCKGMMFFLTLMMLILAVACASIPLLPGLIFFGYYIPWMGIFYYAYKIYDFCLRKVREGQGEKLAQFLEKLELRRRIEASPYENQPSIIIVIPPVVLPGSPTELAALLYLLPFAGYLLTLKTRETYLDLVKHFQETNPSPTQTK
ncbi:MAG: hypothetical protein GXO26_01400 [Crenarchaeota archaeon]|nr:hypothetical protein [Thermoproteota archaeon]